MVTRMKIYQGSWIQPLECKESSVHRQQTTTHIIKYTLLQKIIFILRHTTYIPFHWLIKRECQLSSNVFHQLHLSCTKWRTGSLLWEDGVGKFTRSNRCNRRPASASRQQAEHHRITPFPRTTAPTVSQRHGADGLTGSPWSSSGDRRRLLGNNGSHI